jgi:tripartite-type tricarboxylate transporter receptor subunit TctC
MRLSRRTACRVAPAVLIRGAHAQTRTITLISGAPAGTVAALWVQAFAPFLERHWPLSSVRVVALPGDRGMLAAQAIAAAESGTFGVIGTPMLLARLAETGTAALLDRFTLVAAVVEESVVLVTHPDAADTAPFRALPGRTATLGTPPSGSAAALAARALARFGVPIDPIAFASAAAARKAVETRSTDLAMLAMPDAIGALRDGRLTALGVAAARRHRLLPEAPTLAELGQPVRLTGRLGLAMPRATGVEDGPRLLAALTAIVADPEFAAQTDEQGYSAKLLRRDLWVSECRELLRDIADPMR